MSVSKDLTFEQFHEFDFTEDEICNERWMPVNGFTGYYEVSNLGNVRSVERVVSYITKLGVKSERILPSKILSPWIDFDGYSNVSLSLDNRSYAKRVHRLVLEAFNPVQGSDKLQCNHKNFNRHDNRLINLEWMTNLENTLYSTVCHKPFRGKTRSVTDLTSGCVYPSMRAAAIAMTSECADSSIRDAIQNRRTYHGHVFVFTDDITDSFDTSSYVSEVLNNSRTNNQVSWRPVIDLVSNCEYPSIRQAAICVEGTQEGLINSIQNHRPYKNRVFVYADSVSAISDVAQYIQDAYSCCAGDPWKQVKIVDLITGDVYKSMNSAAAILGIDPEKLRRSIKSKATCEGHIFADNLDMTDIEKRKYIQDARNRSGQGIMSSVTELISGQNFPSLESAGKSVGGSGSMVKSAIDNKICYKGRVFILSRDLTDDFDRLKYIEDCKERSKTRTRGIKCIETGKAYKSIAEVCKELNVTRDIFTYRRNDNIITFRELHYVVGSV